MRPVVVAFLLFVSVQTIAQPASPKFIGSWTGTVKQGSEDLEFTLHVAPADSGGLRAFFDFPAQNVRTMAIEDAAFHGSEVLFTLGNTRFQGTVDAAGTVIAGKMIDQAGQETVLDLARSSAVPTLPATESAVEDPDGYAGDFTGAIEVGGGLEASFHLRRTAEGYAATMDVPAQGARGLSADAATIEDGVLTITFGFGSYRGTYSGDKASLDGIWTQGGRDIPLDMQRVAPAP